jgi:hypothetical protein
MNSTVYATKNANVMSIYIPRMDIRHSEHYVAYVLQQFGSVKRIDFTTLNKKPGFDENFDNTYKSAFVHLDVFWDCLGPNGRQFWTEIENEKSYSLKIVPQHDYQVGQKEYWICLKNKTPVRSTMMNIHQVVENSRYLENLVLEQGKQLLKQAEEMNELKALVKSMLTFDQQLFEKNDDCFSVTDSESETSSSNKRVFNSCDLCGNE